MVASEKLRNVEHSHTGYPLPVWPICYSFGAIHRSQHCQIFHVILPRASAGALFLQSVKGDGEDSAEARVSFRPWIGFNTFDHRKLGIKVHSLD